MELLFPTIFHHPLQTYHGKMKQTVLLVEDQAIIATDKAECIRNLGYTVAIAHSGESAISA